MPEFPGYCGPANQSLPIIKVKAVTTRKNPIMQTCIGPSEEHVSMAGIPTEASILSMLEKAYPGKVKNVYCASPGGGKYIAVIQFCKTVPSDEGRQRQAALLAFSAFAELKHVFLVDEDVDCFDMNDVMWGYDDTFSGRYRSDSASGRTVPSARPFKQPGIQSVHPYSWNRLQSHLRLHRPVRSEGAVCTRKIYGCRSAKMGTGILALTHIKQDKFHSDRGYETS